MPAEQLFEEMHNLTPQQEQDLLIEEHQMLLIELQTLGNLFDEYLVDDIKPELKKNPTELLEKISKVTSLLNAVKLRIVQVSKKIP